MIRAQNISDNEPLPMSERIKTQNSSIYTHGDLNQT